MAEYTIKQLIRRIAEKQQEVFSRVCKVDAVDEAARTIDVTELEDGTQVFNVRLQADPDQTTGLVIIPKVGSNVLITWLDNTRAYMALCTDADKVVYNNGDNGGLINISDLVTKFNALEADLNTIKAIFSSWVTVPNDGGAALKALTASWSQDTLEPTVAQDLEDDKFLH